MKKACLIILATVLLAGVVIIGCAAPSPAPSTAPSPALTPAPESIKIGIPISRTGFDAAVGGPSKDGYELGVAKINQDGGVYVKEFDKRIPLELLFLEMESNPDKAIARAEELHSQYNVPVACGTTMISAAAEIFEKNRLPVITAAQTVSELNERGYRYWFTIDAINRDIAPVVVQGFDGLPQNARPQKWAIFEEQLAFVVELCGFVEEAATAKGYEIVYEGQYATMTRDLRPLIMEAKKAGAEVVFCSANPPDGITLVKQIKEVGYTPKAVFIIRGCDDPAWGLLGETGEYIMGNLFWSSTLKFPGNEELIAAYKAKFNNRMPHPLNGSAYASIQVVADAIERAGALDRDKIRDAMAATDLMTVKGQIKFRPDNSVMDPVYMLGQWQNKVMEIVWPDALKTKPLIYPIPW